MSNTKRSRIEFIAKAIRDLLAKGRTFAAPFFVLGGHSARPLGAVCTAEGGRPRAARLERDRQPQSGGFTGFQKVSSLNLHILLLQSRRPWLVSEEES